MPKLLKSLIIFSVCCYVVLGSIKNSDIAFFCHELPSGFRICPDGYNAKDASLYNEQGHLLIERSINKYILTDTAIYGGADQGFAHFYMDTSMTEPLIFYYSPDFNEFLKNKNLEVFDEKTAKDFDQRYLF